MAAGQSAIPAESATTGARLAAAGVGAYVEAMKSLMNKNANPSSVHVVRYDLIQGRDIAQVVQGMELPKNERFYVWVTPQEEAGAKAVLETLGVKYVVSDSYIELKNQLQNAGQRFILTSGENDLAFAGDVLSDISSLNKAAIFDESMAKEATIETVLAASFLAGARDEAVLAIVGISAKGRIRPPAKTANLRP